MTEISELLENDEYIDPNLLSPKNSTEKDSSGGKTSECALDISKLAKAAIGNILPFNEVRTNFSIFSPPKQQRAKDRRLKDRVSVRTAASPPPFLRKALGRKNGAPSLFSLATNAYKETLSSAEKTKEAPPTEDHVFLAVEKEREKTELRKEEIAFTEETVDRKKSASEETLVVERSPEKHAERCSLPKEGALEEKGEELDPITEHTTKIVEKETTKKTPSEREIKTQEEKSLQKEPAPCEKGTNLFAASITRENSPEVQKTGLFAKRKSSSKENKSVASDLKTNAADSEAVEKETTSELPLEKLADTESFPLEEKSPSEGVEIASLEDPVLQGEGLPQEEIDQEPTQLQKSDVSSTNAMTETEKRALKESLELTEVDPFLEESLGAEESSLKEVTEPLETAKLRDASIEKAAADPSEEVEKTLASEKTFNEKGVTSLELEDPIKEKSSLEPQNAEYLQGFSTKNVGALEAPETDLDPQEITKEEVEAVVNNFPPELIEGLSGLGQSVDGKPVISYRSISRQLELVWRQYCTVIDNLRQKKALSGSKNKTKFKERGAEKADLTYKKLWPVLTASAMYMVAAGMQPFTKDKGSFLSVIQSLLNNSANPLQNALTIPPDAEFHIKEADYQRLLNLIANLPQSSKSVDDLVKEIERIIQEALSAEVRYTQR